jgi:hypothetical protein
MLYGLLNKTKHTKLLTLTKEESLKMSENKVLKGTKREEASRRLWELCL